MVDRDGYRPNVGMVVFDHAGRVWLGKRSGARPPHDWQFPQGGVDPGEDCDGAMLPQSQCSQLPEGYDQGALSCSGCQYGTANCCFDDLGDGCSDDDECCGALDCDADASVCCTNALGDACGSDEACCGDLNCDGNACCTNQLGDACSDDNDCCGDLNCNLGDGNVCCTDLIHAECDGDANTHDTQCCGNLVCSNADRCCLPAGASCVDGNTNDSWCCSGNCNNGSNNCA